MATFTWTGLFHFDSEWMPIQNRNAHVNTSVWPYRSDPNEFSFRFGVLVYTDWTGLHCPCKRIGIHESFWARNCVRFLWPRPKILFPYGLPMTMTDWRTNRNILLSLSANQTHFKSSMQQASALARTRTHTLASNFRAAWILSLLKNLYLPQMENNAHLTHLKMKR